MYQKLLNISITRETDNRNDGTTGLLTMIHIEKVLPDGSTEHLRSSCSYDTVENQIAADFANRSVKRALALKGAA